MITRIRNAGRAHHEKVEMPASKLRERVAQVLKDEGYIKDFLRHKDGVQGAITVILKYDNDGDPVISMISRASRPGLRRYVQSTEIPRIRSGMGISILSTSRGVMADRQARKLGVGGELLCVVA
jgi:small subunit ribosomal protein S8